MIIADDHGLFRQGLRQLLETEGYAVEAEATSGDEALTAVAEHQGCVLLLDIAMPGMNGLDVARRLAERGDDVKVVMLSAREDRDALFSAISAGARGYVAKDAEPDQLFAAIDLVLRGGTVLSTGVAQNLGEGIRQLDYAPGAYEQRRLALTDRELEILRLLATPKSPAQMASQLFLSQEDGAEPHLGDLPQARRAQPLRGHRQGHGAAPHRQQGLERRTRRPRFRGPAARAPAASHGSASGATRRQRRRRPAVPRDSGARPYSREGSRTTMVTGDGRDPAGSCEDAKGKRAKLPVTRSGGTPNLPTRRRARSRPTRSLPCLASKGRARSAWTVARPGHVRGREGGQRRLGCEPAVDRASERQGWCTRPRRSLRANAGTRERRRR